MVVIHIDGLRKFSVRVSGGLQPWRRFSIVHTKLKFTIYLPPFHTLASPRPSQTMRMASLQRLLAWPAVCRSFLGEKEEDSSLPIGLWDQPGAFSNGKGYQWKPLGGNTSAGSASSEFPKAAVVSLIAATTGKLSGREARLTKEQRYAMRLLCTNLAVFPSRPKSRPRRARRSSNRGAWPGPPSSFEPSLVAAEAEAAIREAETSLHHHHTVICPAIPPGMARIELPARDSWLMRSPAGGPAGTTGGDGAAPAGSNPPGDVSVIRYPAWFADNMVGSNHRGGDATLLNPQPACGMGGLCWPTLYDLTMVKRRQRERLRDCFRRFRRGQKLDVRDPSGEWMGAVVLWAPPVCSRCIPVPSATTQPAAVGAGGVGGAGAPAGPHGGLDVANSDSTTPEWRRLLQLALLADGGPMNANQGGGAAATAAGAAGAAGNGGVAAATISGRDDEEVNRISAETV